MYGEIPRQRELITRDEKDRIDPFTGKVKVARMRFWTANRPENLSIFCQRIYEHFPGAHFDCLEIEMTQASFVNINRYLNENGEDKYVRPREMNVKQDSEKKSLTVFYAERPPNLEQFLEKVNEHFRGVPYSELEIIPGFMNVEIKRLPQPKST